jgi:hypothetical protein
MILEEDRPGLQGGFGRPGSGDIALNGVLGDGEVEFEPFTANPFGTPQRFSCAIGWIRATVSADSLGRPPRGRDLNFQKRRSATV